MAHECQQCKSSRLVRLSYAGMAAICGEVDGRQGQLSSEGLSRLQSGVAGMVQMAFAESLVLGERPVMLWLCRACGYWQCES